MKNTLIIAIVSLFIWACGNNSSTPAEDAPTPTQTRAGVVDDGKGFGEVKKVELNNPLEQALVEQGKAIYELKCLACHKLGENRLVGPGFKGVTERRKPEWIMNMITNVEVMLEKDPTAQKLLEECLTRMPNQNLTTEDARAILEFLYSNDTAS